MGCRGVGRGSSGECFADSLYLDLLAVESNNGLGFDVRFAGVLFEEVLIKRPVIVVVVAAGRRAGVEGEPLVAWTVLANVLMAQRAVIGRQRYAHRVGYVGAVFGVAGDALIGCELIETVGISRIAELLKRMGVLCRLELFGMATLASLLDCLGPGKGRGMAGSAGQLYLMVPARCLPDE